MVVYMHEIVMEAIRALEDPATQTSIGKYRKNFLWGMKNFQRLKKQYGGKIALILNEKVVFADEDIGKVRKRFISFFGPLLKAQIALLKIPRKDEISFYLG